MAKSKGGDGPHPVDIHVGARVKLRRMILGISQDALGKSLGLTFQQVQKYEKGANRIGSSRLYELSKLLSVPIQFFFDDYGDADGMIGGFAEDDAGAPVMSLMSSPEGVELCKHFAEIEDAKVRKSVVDLVKSFADQEKRKDDAKSRRRA